MNEPFNGVDFYDVEEFLSPRNVHLRDRMRAWVSERFLPTAGEHYSAGKFPMEWVPEMAKLNAFGGTIKAMVVQE